MQRFENITYISNPTDKTSICFSCDDEYFKKYGQYNIKSCIKTNQSAHCHIINPSPESLEIIKSNIKKTISFSIEINDFNNCNRYQIKTYYYCSRFYLGKHLFNKFNLSHLWITDADVIFHEKVEPIQNTKLSVAYNKNGECLWKKTTGAIIFICYERKNFLDHVIDEYEKRYNNIDLNTLSNIMLNPNKNIKGDLLGLDQVSMAVVIEKYYLNDPDFLNLSTIANLKSKKEKECKIWIPVGKSKDKIRNDGFKNIEL